MFYAFVMFFFAIGALAFWSYSDEKNERLAFLSSSVMCTSSGFMFLTENDMIWSGLVLIWIAAFAFYLRFIIRAYK